MNGNLSKINLTLSKVALLALGTFTYLATSLAVANESSLINEQLEQSGYLVYGVHAGRPQKLMPIASTIQQLQQDELIELTLNQTFHNSGDSLLVADYVMPMPNPAALINYQVTNQNDYDCAGQNASTQSITLASGESVTLTVTYQLLNKQLVSFHPADATMYALSSAEMQLADNK